MNKYIELDFVKEIEQQKRKENNLTRNKLIKSGIIVRYLLLLIGIIIVFIGINPIISLPFFAPSIVTLVIKIFFPFHSVKMKEIL